MDRTFITNHNAMISDRDDYYDLGDFAFRCSPQYAVKILKQLKGRLHFLLGNHDKPLRQAWRMGLLDSVLNSGKLELIADQDKTKIVAKYLKIDKQILILSHYAYRSWPNAFRGAWHLFGHSHGNLDDFYRSTDVGVDKNKYPVNYEQIKSHMIALETTFSEK